MSANTTKQEILPRIIFRILDRAAGLGSQARTVKGAHAAIMRAYAALPEIPRRGVDPKKEWQASRSLDWWAIEKRRPHRARTTVCPLRDPNLGARADELARAAHPHRQNWEPAAPTDSQVSTGEILTTNHGHYSRQCAYTRFTYRPLYQSALVVARSGEVAIYYRDCQPPRRIHAPAGLRWVADVNGAALRSKDGTTYHPQPSDLRARDFARRVRAGLSAIRRGISEAEHRAAVAESVLRNCRRQVSLRAVSRAVGNCAAGTEAWLLRLGLSQRERATVGAVVRLASLKGERSPEFNRAACYAAGAVL